MSVSKEPQSLASRVASAFGISEKLFKEMVLSDPVTTQQMIEYHKQAESAQAMITQNSYNGVQGLLGAQGYVGTNPPDIPYTWDLNQKLRMRLNLAPHGMPTGFDYLNAVANDKGEHVAVFIMKDGKSFIIEDDANLFPSDRLIAQIATLRG